MGCYTHGVSAGEVCTRGSRGSARIRLVIQSGWRHDKVAGRWWREQEEGTPLAGLVHAMDKEEWVGLVRKLMPPPLHHLNQDRRD
jgi:hypothetical protein